MNKPSAYERFHWKTLSIFGKIFGTIMTLVSLIFCSLVIAEALGNSDVEVYPLWSLVWLIPLLILGILFIRAKPYYPEKYSEWYSSQKKEDKNV